MSTIQNRKEKKKFCITIELNAQRMRINATLSLMQTFVFRFYLGESRKKIFDSPSGNNPMKPLTEYSICLLNHSFWGLGLLKPLHGSVEQEMPLYRFYKKLTLCRFPRIKAAFRWQFIAFLDDRFTEEYSFARPENIDRQKISSKQTLSHGVIFSFLRTVPTIVIAHTFCASPDTRISYRQCLLIQGYFCAV